MVKHPQAKGWGPMELCFLQLWSSCYIYYFRQDDRTNTVSTPAQHGVGAPCPTVGWEHRPLCGEPPPIGWAPQFTFSCTNRWHCAHTLSGC